MAVRWLVLIPLACVFVGIGFANRVEPIVLGMPFLFFWVVLSVVVASVTMGIVYKFDPANKEGE